MIDFTEEQKMLRDTVRRLVEDKFPPERARQVDETDHYPREFIAELAELDLTGLTIPEEYGGVGRDIVGAGIVTEELARRSLALAWVYVESVFFGGENLRHLGSEGQKQRFLPGLARGELLFSYALTEPNAGSDTAACQTTAIANGHEGLLVNGTKIFISGASQTDFMLTLVRTDKSLSKHRGLSMVIIDRQSTGISTRPINKVGVHGSDTCEVVLEEVSVPLENVLGGPECLNKGWQQLLSTLDVEHVHLAAEGVGMAQGALDEALRYVSQRMQFGQPIGKFQVVQHMLAEMATEIAAARSLTYDVARLAQVEEPCAMEGAMAKYFATEVAKRAALNSMQLHGGYGYSMEYDIQRYVRDALVLTVGGGTSEIQKNIIARALGL